MYIKIIYHTEHNFKSDLLGRRKLSCLESYLTVIFFFTEISQSKKIEAKDRVIYRFKLYYTKNKFVPTFSCVSLMQPTTSSG